LSVAGIVFLFFMPESPRFLISKKRFEEARVVFKWIGTNNGLDAATVKERLNDITFEGEEREDEFAHLNDKDSSLKQSG